MNRCSSLNQICRPAARSTMKSLPAWQRENRLHRQFRRVNAARAKGKSIQAALKQFAWYWDGESYRSDPTKRCAFGMQTLCRLYQEWRRGGEVASALRVRFKGMKLSVPAPLLCRFVEFCSRLRFPSLAHAWAEFSRRDGCFERSVARGNLLPITYGKLVYAFNGAKFRQLQADQRAIETAQRNLALHRLQYIAQLRERLPDAPRRPWRRRPLVYEI
jgi:hypothetical protein